MALFDDKGRLNESEASSLYRSVASQVTGDPHQYSPMAGAGAIPLVGQPQRVEDFEPLEMEQLSQFRELAAHSLASGFPPETQVAISLGAMAQLVRSLEVLNVFVENDAPEKGIEEEEMKG